MNSRLLRILLLTLAIAILAAPEAVGQQFTPAERQQISVPTPGLFEKRNYFEIDLTRIGRDGYSFPLPVGKAIILKNNTGLQITTQKGDAVKAMFEGDVRLAYKHRQFGNIIVIRHRNGLETVYGDNAQNLVKVGDHVKAGQTIAIVGGVGLDSYCTFSIMVDGRRINPETIIELKSHRLRPATLRISKTAKGVTVTSRKHEDEGKGLMAYTGEEPFKNTSSVTIDLRKLAPNRWAYPLPGAKMISPYGGKRKHSGVDLKTKPNDKILAAFEGVVVRSGFFSGYGNCIEIKHANGLRTLYGHQSKNLVKVGDKVKAGQAIGLTGRTGRASTEHLHFELFCQERRYDPSRIFDHDRHKLKDITIVLTKSGEMKIKK